MKNALIKLIKKQYIDANTIEKPFVDIFTDTFTEFGIQLQNLGISTWQQVLDRRGQESAQRINNSVYRAALTYINSLNNLIPGLTNTLQTNQIQFVNCNLNIIQSDIRDRNLHKISLYYQSDILTLIDSFSDRLLLANGDKSSDLQANKEIKTFLVNISQPDLEINIYKRI